jgi:FAD/FMN-containing dehydrogenase/Fe-S oxidoreductase
MRPTSEAIASDLGGRIEGDVRFDLFSRGLYATDASIYQVMPIGVVLPRSAEDVLSVVEYASERGIPLLPRGAGTSLAGQAVGEAIVLDFSRYMNRLISLDPERRTAVVEPGLVLDRLNAEAAAHGLKFAPDPASSSRSTVGGAVGNNSTGAHSLVYDRTDGYLLSLDMALASGEVLRAHPFPEPDKAGSLRRELLQIIEPLKAEIDLRYPKIQRNVTGYNLAGASRDGGLDLCRLIAGSEGTLGILTSAELQLVECPPATALAVLCFDQLFSALRSVPDILRLKPSAVELLDGHLLRLASERETFRPTVRRYPPGTEAVLMVEFEGASEQGAKARLTALQELVNGQRPPPRRILLPSGAAEQAEHWKLRKTGLSIDAKHLPFIEDSAVPVEHLADYVSDIQDLLARHGTYAVYFAHAGPGCLHIHPFINLKERRGIDLLRRISAEASDLVLKYAGAISGEHGDGQSRTAWVRKQYGDRIYEAFGRIKRLFDPDNIMNPGKIVSDRADPGLNLRIDPDDRAPYAPTTLDFSYRGSFDQAIELCNGCGGCRVRETGVMCPSFQATGEEIASTRGRANLLRLAISGRLPAGTLASPAFKEAVLDLCLGCKACARECPSGVDLATLKSELLHRFHREHGVPLDARLVGHLRTVNRMGSLLAPWSNWLGRSALLRRGMERFAGWDRRRPLPVFRRETFERWFRRRSGPGRPDGPRVALLADCHVNYVDPGLGRIAVELLETMGATVALIDGVCCGRPAFSKGLLDLAKEQAQETRRACDYYLRRGYSIVGIEPSCAVTLQEEYPLLLGRVEGEPVARQSFEIMEFIDRALERGELSLKNPRRLDQRIGYHGHCHLKAHGSAEAAVRVLGRIPGTEVRMLDTGCCGMAGSFGYEVKHYDLSQRLADRLFRQWGEHGGRPLASGFSCRTQALHGLGIKIDHPLQALAEALK